MRLSSWELVNDIVFDGRGYCDPKYLVVHETANPGATALNHVNYWSSGQQGGEAHYVLDWTRKVYHTTLDSRACWHVGGDPNSWTNGVELCHATNPADFDAVWETAVEFCAWYLDWYGWGVDRLTSHRIANEQWATYSDHTDPDGYFAEYGRTWAQFVDAVEKKLNGEDEPVSDYPGRDVDVYHANYTNAQKWKLEKKGDYYIIRSMTGKKDKVLDVYDGKAVHTGSVQVYPANGTDAQLWTIVKLSGKWSGYYEIAPKKNSKIRLDVYGGSTEDLTKVWLYESNNTAAQKWLIVDNEDGTITFLSAKAHHPALDVYNGGQPF